MSISVKVNSWADVIADRGPLFEADRRAARAVGHFIRMVDRHLVEDIAKTRSCRIILQRHHEILKDDPEHLSTAFIRGLAKCKCRRPRRRYISLEEKRIRKRDYTRAYRARKKAEIK